MLERGAPRGRSRVMTGSRVANRNLRRRRGAQGPRCKAGFLRESLWDWFVDVRAAVAGRIPPKFVLKYAEDMADAAVRHMACSGEFIPVPRITKQWLLRWQRDYGVVFRKPNKRFKCSYATLSARCKAMWRNVYMFRAVCQELFGRDPLIFGLDQTPIYMNEAGSRNVGSLEIDGAPEVRLKENAALTRQRFSVLTCVTSDAASAMQPGRLPIEVLFKGKTRRVLANVTSPEDVNIACAFQVKGSYRADNMVAYLDRCLDPWTPGRAGRVLREAPRLQCTQCHAVSARWALNAVGGRALCAPWLRARRGP